MNQRLIYSLLFIPHICMEHLLCGSSLIVLENTSLDSKALSSDEFSHRMLHGFPANCVPDLLRCVHIPSTDTA